MSSTDQHRPGAVSSVLHHARLEGVRSQVAFSLLLDTLARPGTVRSIATVGLPAGVPSPLVVPLALADVETSVAVVDADPDATWAVLVVDATGAPLADPTEAAQVVFLSGFDATDVLAVRRGTSADPEDGTRVAIACRGLQPLDADPGEADDRPAGPAGVVVALSGPGVEGTRHLRVDGLDPAVFAAIAEANRMFPAGIDCWLVSADGDLAAIPRSTRIECLHSSTTNEERV